MGNKSNSLAMETSYSQLIKKKKEQANRYFKTGQLHQAHTIYTALCHANRQDEDAWFMLGIINGQMGRLQDAEHCSKHAITINPTNFAAWDNLGLALLLQGRHQEAQACYENSLRINPNNEKAYNGLGSLCREKGQFQEAIANFERALKIKPTYAEARNNLGNIYYKDLCQFDQAIAAYREALKTSPRYVDACFNLGAAHESLGDYQEALKYFHRALKTCPGTPATIAAISSVHEKCQDYEKAYNILKPLLSDKTISASVALAFANVAPRVDKTTEAAEYLDKALSNQELSLINRQELLFKLGELLDKAHDFDRAFPVYQAANSLRPYPFNQTTIDKQFAALKSAFNKTTLPLMSRASNNSELPVFIVGMPRSGTTLIEQIVASHPLIFGAGELPYLGEIITSTQHRFNIETEEPYPGLVAELGSNDLDALANEYLDKLTTHSADASRITDKMPHNFLHLGLIDCLFPGTRIIHCLRDPIDTCLSIYFHNFSANHPYASDLRNLGIYYKAYQDLMLHWKESLRIPILDVQYEELVANQEQTSRKMIDFCGMDWDDSCLQYYESKRVVSTPSYNQVRQPMYSKSVHRWKKYERFLGPLKMALE